MDYELYHYGTPGMKWGIRRYQNKDGSLTSAGKKRYAKLEAEMKQLKPKRSSSKAKPEQDPRKKLVSEMTDDELRDRANRMRLETEYYNAARNLSQANPVQISKGKRFVNSLVNEVVAPAAKKAGQAWAEKFMKDQLGLNSKDPITRLENQAKKLKAEKEIAEYKRDIEKIKKGGDGYPEVKTWDDMDKRRKYLDEEEKRRRESGDK